jgi:hypothetical protein
VHSLRSLLTKMRQTCRDDDLDIPSLTISKVILFYTGISALEKEKSDLYLNLFRRKFIYFLYIISSVI